MKKVTKLSTNEAVSSCGFRGKTEDSFILQYAFFMSKDGEILVCDEVGYKFLKTIDLEIFYLQLESFKINSAITNTTIILGGKSYNLRMVPTDLQSETDDLNSRSVEDIEYLIVLQDQSLFSYIFQRLKHAKSNNHLDVNADDPTEIQLNRIFDSSRVGIFITNSKGIVIFANAVYESATGLSLTNIIGKNIADLGTMGFFNPLITPAILETRQNLTVLQKLATGKHAIISGSPIYGSNGDPVLIITCVNVVTKIIKADFPDQSYEPAKLKLNSDQRKKEYSIDMIAESRIMKTILQEAIHIARYDVTVLLLGDSGVGKEVIASVIHASSLRNKEKFVKINCSAITPSLLESELFGYEAGAFTGALAKGKQGLFEIAHQGTLLLDEIGDMPIELQAKLLRVIQNQEYYRIGGVEPIRSNVRIIASTNKNLQKMIKIGEFREDLFYRLNVISIEIPPLQHRKADIKPLLLHFCYHYNNKYNLNKQFSAELLQVLENYNWPGNIRELKNLVERLLILCIEDILIPEHLYNKYKLAESAKTTIEAIQINDLIPLKDAVSAVEESLVMKAMKSCGSTRKAAELLGVSQTTVLRKLKEYDLGSKCI
ncbi:sigma-54 interaction domain-containing protein [Anoxybacterium hadale]|uniref:sigma-54 interaction domain-containing protein n=1 Tax=Anoxybacterium hadale TaxID=3408580 RepID=UPI003AFFE24D